MTTRERLECARKVVQLLEELGVHKEEHPASITLSVCVLQTTLSSLCVGCQAVITIQSR